MKSIDMASTQPINRHRSRLATYLFFAIGTLLAAVSEAIAIFLTTQRFQAISESYLLLYAICILIPLPWMALAFTHKRVVRVFSRFDIDEKVASYTSTMVLLAMETTYLALMFALLLLLTIVSRR